MKPWVPLVLQALSFAVGFAEVILPSFGILSILCGALFIWSWSMLIGNFGRGMWLGVGLADLVLIPIVIRSAFVYLGRSPISHRTDVGHGSGLEETDRELGRHVGATALAETALRPTGRIRIGDEAFEAQSAGEWVERGAQVKIVAVSGSRFQVEKTNP